MRSRHALFLMLALGACEGTISSPGDDDTIGGDDAPSTSTDDPDSELPPLITIAFSESDADIVNPERGYYVDYEPLDGVSASYVRSGGHSLAIATVNLEDYRDRSLDSTVLGELEAGFARVRSAGIKLVLRFMYNSGYEPDAPKARILQHLEQLAPILEENADIISVMQAGLIGAWGEWHSSTNDLDNPDDQTEILNALLVAVPETRGVQVRTPMDVEASFPGGPLEATVAYDGSPRSRVGHHNDCFLSSATDYGTFASPVEEWQGYVAADGRFTAIGGETCAIYTPRTDCDAAVGIMADQHWSYLNSQYNVQVINSWVDQGCAGEIERRLGYRFALERVAHSEAVPPGGGLDLEIDIHNSGFASPYNRRPVEIVLTDGTVRHVAQLVETDARWFAAGETTTIAARMRVPADLAPGTYTLAVRFPDEMSSLAADPRYAIQLANDDVWDDSTGDNVLTRTLLVDPATPGPRDPDATTFHEMR